MSSKLEELKAVFEEELKRLNRLEKDKVKCISIKEQLERQLNENKIVEEVCDFFYNFINIHN